MDHAHESETDSSSIEQPETQSASTDPSNDSWRPADYYASPPKPSRFPRWVPISCGVAALFALVIMAGVGMFLESGGMKSMVALAIGQFQGEIDKMAADDVTPDAREKLESSLKDVRERLTSGTLDQAKVLPLLEEIQKVSRDEKLSMEEIEGLQEVLEAIGEDDSAEHTSDN